jgi:arylsulfatase A-like enzyme
MGQQGYELYYYGKWHTGPGTAHDYGCEGFSHTGYGNPYITPEYEAYVKARGMEVASFDVEHVFYDGPQHPGTRPGPGHRLTWPNNWEHVTGVLETPDDTHESMFLANLACERLRKLAERSGDSRFFLRVDFYGPHMPYLAGADYVDMYDPEQIQEYGSFRDDLANKPRVYRTEYNKPFSQEGQIVLPSVLPWSEWQRILSYCYGQISMVDAAGGMILDELDRLGLAENTLVIWTTDHGDGVASHGGHFDKNAYLSEEVLRIPMAARWPGRIPAGEVSQCLVSNLDLPATLLDVTEASCPWPVDGTSLLDLLEHGREDIMCETYGHHGERMKVVGRALVTARYKYAAYRYLDEAETTREVYDLQEDPYELNNLAKDPDHSQLVRDHRQRLRAWRARTEDTIPLD